MSPSTASSKSRVFFFSHPRTASNLLVKLLSEQEGWSYNDYNFHPAYQYAIRRFNLEDPSQTSLESLAEYSKQIALAHKNLETFLRTAEESVSTFIQTKTQHHHNPAKQQTHAFAKDHALMLLRPELLYGRQTTFQTERDPPTHTTSQLSKPTRDRSSTLRLLLASHESHHSPRLPPPHSHPSNPHPRPSRNFLLMVPSTIPLFRPHACSILHSRPSD